MFGSRKADKELMITGLPERRGLLTSEPLKRTKEKEGRQFPGALSTLESRDKRGAELKREM